MWRIMFEPDGTKTTQAPDNPQYYTCKRFFTDEKYRVFSKLPIDEVVSVDSMLFTERSLLTADMAAQYTPSDDEQALCVRCLERDMPFVMEEIDGFTFCGFDLAEQFEISALTNCGGFDETFTHKDLNAFGLIPDFTSARSIQTALAANNPNEEHADCLLFAIWRKIQEQCHKQINFLA